MKRYFTIIFSALTLISCENKTQSNNKSVSTDQSTEIDISIDTLHIPITGDMRKVAWFRNNFYAMFETSRKNTTEFYKKMIVFNKKGEFIEDVFIPKEIQDMVYYDLIISNDSLYVKETQFEKKNLVLGEYVADFELTKTKDFPIFIDDIYKVYSLCNGEFGGTIYFQNKQTGKSYEAGSTCPIVVNKIDKQYYVTNYLGHMMGAASVLKISDPSELENSTLNFNAHQGSRFNNGVEVLIDTLDFYIATSFVYDHKLLNVYSDKQGTYIGKIENKRMKPVFKFPFKFSADFNQQLGNGQQVLTCYFSNDRSGVLIIDGNHFKFYRLN
jgi:hypothetical protein